MAPGRSTNRPVVLSVEQALSMPYATLRFVHLGWRVIRIEATPLSGRASVGDPNRTVGRAVAGDDRHSYYVAPNVGKEAIALNLKQAAGQRLLAQLMDGLGVDVFCTNTMPSHHESLGIEYAQLRRIRDELIWCGISAMGIAHPTVPGYDPMMQALCGYMDITGHKDGPPIQCGPPITDLKAGDEVFSQVLLAMWERERTGKGKCIDVSMAHAAVSWLQTFLPMLDMGSGADELRRSGNEHRQFIPTNSYRTQDGFLFVAIGSDAQWTQFVSTPMFACLGREVFATNEGRRGGRHELHRLIGEVTGTRSTDELCVVLEAAAIPHSPITRVEDVAELAFVRESALCTHTPDGRRIRLPPPAVRTPHLDDCGGELAFAPAYGENTDDILGEAGVSPSEISSYREAGVIA